MSKRHKTVSLTDEQRVALEAVCRRRKVDALVWKRARAFLLLDAGEDAGTVCRILDIGPSVLTEWRFDFAGAGLVPSHGDCLRVGKARVGVVTSAVKSPWLGKVIALARIDVTHASLGTAIEIGQLDGEQKRLKAVVTAFPHFDPTKERVKGNYD